MKYNSRIAIVLLIVTGVVVLGLLAVAAMLYNETDHNSTAVESPSVQIATTQVPLSVVDLTAKARITKDATYFSVQATISYIVQYAWTEHAPRATSTPPILDPTQYTEIMNSKKTNRAKALTADAQTWNEAQTASAIPKTP